MKSPDNKIPNDENTQLKNTESLNCNYIKTILTAQDVFGVSKLELSKPIRTLSLFTAFMATLKISFISALYN